MYFLNLFAIFVYLGFIYTLIKFKFQHGVGMCVVMRITGRVVERRNLKKNNFPLMDLKVSRRYIRDWISTVNWQRTKTIMEMHHFGWSLCAFAMCVGFDFLPLSMYDRQKTIRDLSEEGMNRTSAQKNILAYSPAGFKKNSFWTIHPVTWLLKTSAYKKVIICIHIIHNRLH